MWQDYFAAVDGGDLLSFARIHMSGATYTHAGAFGCLGYQLRTAWDDAERQQRGEM